MSRRVRSVDGSLARLPVGLLAFAMTLGCSTTQLITSPGGARTEYAPVNVETRPGLVRYVWSDDRETNETRRNDAYKMMHEACGGDYRLLDEDARSEPTALVGTPAGGHVTTVTYWYMEFECVSQ